MRKGRNDRESEFLQLVTKISDVGVMIETHNGLKALNQQMELFAHKCGGLSVFKIQGAESLERSLTDINNNKVFFRITSIDFEEENIILVRDITESKIQRSAIEHIALHDSLTNLPSRLLFYDRLKHAILVVQRENKPMALLMVDIDCFREINDNFGHYVGDQALIEVGARLCSVLRKSDTVARFGSDEFMIILPTADAKHAQQAANRLLSVFERPFFIEGNSIYVGASIGIALCPEHGEDTDVLVQLAEVAMNTAKRIRGNVVTYNPKQDQSSRSRYMLVDELRRAIDNNELVLHYQPKVNCSTGQVSGIEALVRWNHPERGVISPDEFIPLAEQTGLIKPLTGWVLDTALRQSAEWQSGGIKISVSVNLSTRNLLDPYIIEEVAGRLKERAIEPALLELEITESALMVDPARSMEILFGLDELGVRISIDDFGTGYSSLAYLKKMPVNEIKIDKSFVINMIGDENDALIVRSIVELAHNLGIKVIAEGVESKEICDMLKEIGCDDIQGYLVSTPLPASELTEWFKKSNWCTGK